MIISLILDSTKVLLIILLFCINTSLIAQTTINFEFANSQITGTAPNQFYEFDIMASSNRPTQFKVAQLYISYNTLGFGGNIVSNGRVTVTQGELLYPKVDGINVATYTESSKDNTNSVLVIQNTWGIVSGSGTGYTLSNQLGSTPIRYAHLRIAIQNINETSGISFVNSLINQGNIQNYYFTTSGTNDKSLYNTVTYGEPLNNPLPVELNVFKAIKSQKGIELRWSTETELNNYGFDIESAQVSGVDTIENLNFLKIGFISGNGNSNSPKEYLFVVNGIKYGKFAFRLKQIDNDGKYQYSQTIEINAGEIPNGFVLEQNYPNPFNPSTIIRFAASESNIAKLKVYDILGNEVAELFNDQLEANKVYDIQFDASRLASGVYYYRLSTNNKSVVKKMLLIK